MRLVDAREERVEWWKEHGLRGEQVAVRLWIGPRPSLDLRGCGH